MPNSTKPAGRRKPTKPYRDFPLFPHATGRWAKKIRGKLRYFGYWSKSPDGDWQQALDLYQEQRDDLHAGRTPRVKGDGLTVAELCNRFLTGKRNLLASNELKRRTFHDYFAVCEKIVGAFGQNRLVADLASDDFERFRAALAKGRGPVILANEMRQIRMVFKYGFDAGLIDRPVRFGPAFKPPSKTVLRRARQKNGPRLFEADELRRILDEAKQPIKAMVLIALNATFGQTDCANLPISAVDLESSWLTFPRPKTAVERRCPLWPETVTAIHEAISVRPNPKDATDDGLVFLTKYGYRWVRDNDNGIKIDSVGLQFGRLLRRLDLKRPGVNFYSLRRTFRTIADECRDQPAIDLIMGHAASVSDMGAVYRQRISDARLKAVVETVRAWLWPDRDCESESIG